MTKVFIDGSSGTTGLRIRDRLLSADGVSIIELPPELRKDPRARKEALNEADVTFLCLPDDAAREAAEMVENDRTVIIDSSTAHRTSPDWAYGFPELGEKFRKKIACSKRIAVPGCHASGFIALVYPLVSAGLISPAAELSAFSLTGYSGGGKKMIEEYKTTASPLFDAPRQYALSQAHKHLPEMTAITGLKTPPCFSPIVSNYYSGMEVGVFLFGSQLERGRTASDVKNAYKSLYKSIIVSYSEETEAGFLSAGKLSGYDNMVVSVFGGEDRLLLVSRFDNLGKGASGAAMQCFNIVTGREEAAGLSL